jgi:hypothetical protein
MIIENVLIDYGFCKKFVVFKHSISTDSLANARNFKKAHNRTDCVGCFYDICFTDEEKQAKLLKSSSNSVARTKQLMTDLVLCNQFELFCTFTFDPQKVNSKQIDVAKLKMSKWLNNAKRNSPELEYLIVAETHKSGALHFHALFKNYKGILKDSGIIRKNRKILNISGWRFGFSTAVKIDNVSAVSLYLQKYISKDMILMPGKKRYWCSRGLKRPQKHVNIDFCEFNRKWLGIKFVYEGMYVRVYDDYSRSSRVAL